MTKQPYPTPSEILSFIVDALDTGVSKKQLNDDMKTLDIDHRIIPQRIDTYIREPLSKYISPEFGEAGGKGVHFTLDVYMKAVVTKIPLHGLTRAEGLEVLNSTVFSMFGATFLAGLDTCKSPRLLPIPLFSQTTGAMEAAFTWLEKNIIWWNSFHNDLMKEEKDKIRRWRNQEERMSVTRSLIHLDEWAGAKYKNKCKWPDIKAALLIANTASYIKHASAQGFNNAQLILGGKLSSQWWVKELYDYSRQLPDNQRDEYMSEKSSSHTNLKQEQREKLDQWGQAAPSDYRLAHFEALWHVSAGDLKKANEYCKNAFKLGLYQGGIPSLFFKHALIIAACQKNPDKTFMKKLKSMSVLFGYDFAEYTQHERDSLSYQYSELVEDWEVDMWKSYFTRNFPESSWFDGVEYDLDPPKIGMLILSNDPSAKYNQPDYRHPDRQIKVGETWQRKMFQLQWFTMSNQVEVVKNLLEKGASVNVLCAETGDTPILSALLGMSRLVPHDSEVLQKPKLSFELISQHAHEPKILNSCTEKMKHTALHAAVDTVEPDILQKVINLGADLEVRGKQEQLTPLYHCINNIVTRKNQGAMKAKFKGLPSTRPDTLHAVRRMNAGWNGITLEEQAQYIKAFHHNPDLKKIKDRVVDIHIDLFKAIPLEAVREMAKVLLEAGADPNAKHNVYGMQGYTPLLFAAQANEAELFELMLKKGGDIETKCTMLLESTNGKAAGEKQVGCSEIALVWESEDVLAVIAQTIPKNNEGIWLG